jgi:arabinose-5-phosphate isomerase
MAVTTPDAAAELELARQVLRTEAGAILGLVDRVDGAFTAAVDVLAGCRGRVLLTGMGKSGLIGRKIAATLSSTGTSAFFLHPADAMHGDLGALQPDDVVVAVSYEGETREVLRLLETIRRIGARMVAITGAPRSTLGQAADVTLDCHVDGEACPLNLAPTSSTTVSLVLGDALAIALLEARGFTAEDFAFSHPGGALGRRLLLKVENIMHGGSELPQVRRTTPLREALLEMTRKGLGMTVVTEDDGRLAGIFTDGDLRRALDRGVDVRQVRIDELMTAGGKTVRPDMLAAEALKIMEDHKISAVVVVDDRHHAIGALNMHDLLRAGVM